MATYFIDHGAWGVPGEVHSTKQNDLGAVRKAADGNSYIYLQGVASTVDGSVVVFAQGTWTTALVAAGKRGNIAIATAATVANTYGWYTYIGQDVSVGPTSAVASNVPLYASGTAGSLDDAAVKGDQVLNCFARNAAAGTSDSLILAIDRAFIGFSNESAG